MQFFRWRTFAVFFRLGMAQEISDYLLNCGVANKNCRFYNFHEAPTQMRAPKDEHVPYQVCYGFWKAFPGQGELIKVVMERSSQLLNDKCLRPMMKLQERQQK